MTREVIKIVRKKAKLWKKYRKTRDITIHSEFKRVEKRSRKKIKKCKREFEKKLANGVRSNPKKFYSYARSKTRTRDTVGPLKGTDGIVENREEGMCKLLNEYFCSVFTKSGRGPEQGMRTDYVGGLIDSLEVNEEEVLNKIKRLKEGKAAGPDGMAPGILIRVKEVIVKPLTIIFNMSLRQGIVPRDWRVANVTPIFKKGKKDDPGNYRPVSLTSVVGKMLESIIRDRLIDHLSRNRSLSLSQHGFTKNRSCLTNLLEFLEDISAKLDEGAPVDVVYFDFSKAFDKVSHSRLVNKLNNYGIVGSVRDWVSGWLSDRFQRVVVNGKVSSWESVLSGVPQGSVLGPLLFLIFIDDIDEGLGAKCLKFADDTKIIGRVESEEDRAGIQRDIDRLGKWGDDWEMSFNVGKCKVLHLGGRKNPCSSYKLNGEDIQEVGKEKDLGVIVDNKLNFNEQCATAAKRGNMVLGIMKRNFNLGDKDVTLKLYKSMVRPHLEYSIQAWSPHTKKNIKLLEGVQRRATKLVRGCRNLEYEDRLKVLGLTTLETRRLRGDMLETFKIVSGMEGLDRGLFFKFNSNINQTRGHNFKLEKPRSRLNIRKFSFGHRVIDEWNSLPQEVVNSTSLNPFKTRIDEHYKNINKI